MGSKFFFFPLQTFHMLQSFPLSSYNNFQWLCHFVFLSALRISDWGIGSPSGSSGGIKSSVLSLKRSPVYLTRLLRMCSFSDKVFRCLSLMLYCLVLLNCCSLCSGIYQLCISHLSIFELFTLVTDSFLSFSDISVSFQELTLIVLDFSLLYAI